MTFISLYQINQMTLIFLTLIITLLTTVRAQYHCLNNGNYTTNSPYGTNLNTLLTTLSTNIDNNGFYNASLGESPDRVNAFALCRGDVYLNTCRTCVRNATSDILRQCPNYRQAILYLEFCTLRFSDETLLGIADSGNNWMWFNGYNATDSSQFMFDLRELITSLRDLASRGDSLRKVAAGYSSTSGFQIIFALEQCTPDLSQPDCNACLMAAASLLPQCCNGLIGGIIFAPSCIIRYEISPFYNEIRLQELVVPLLQPVAGT